MKKLIALSLLLIFLGTSAVAQQVTKEYKLKNLVSDAILENYQNFESYVSIFNQKEGNRLIITGEEPDVDLAIERLTFLDIPQDMVSIDFMIVEYFHGDDFDWSFDLTGGQFGNFSDGRITTGAENGLQFIFNSISRLSPRFQMNLTALVSENKAKIVTNPHLVVQSGDAANLNISETINKFLTQTSQTGFITQELREITAGIVLDIVPVSTGDSIVHLDLNGEFSQFLSTSIGGDTRIDSKSISTKVDLKEGETLIIGGIISEQTNELDAGFPILSKIPILGLFFKRKVNTKQYVERVLYLTPRVYTANEISVANQVEQYNDVRQVTPTEQATMDLIENDPNFIKYENTKKKFGASKERRKNRRKERRNNG